MPIFIDQSKYLNLVTQAGHLHGEEVNIGEVGCFVRGRGHMVAVMMRRRGYVSGMRVECICDGKVGGVVYVSMCACEKDKG